MCGRQWFSAVAIVLFVAVAFVIAAEKKDEKEPPVRQVLVVKNHNYRFQATSKKPLRSIRDEIGKVIVFWKLKKEKDSDKNEEDYELEQSPGVNDKYVKVLVSSIDRSAFALYPVSPGSVRITLEDEAGTKEELEIEVRAEVFVPIGKRETVQMATKKAVKQIVNEGDKIVRVERVAVDPTSVTVTGLSAGDARFSLSGEDGRTETVEVVVRSDQEAGKNVLLLTQDCGVRLQSSNNQPMRSIKNTSEQVLRIRMIHDRDNNIFDLFSVLVEARKPGFSRLEIEEYGGIIAKYEVIVRADGPIPKDHVVITVGQPHRIERALKAGKYSVGDADKDAITVEPDEKDESMLIVTAKRTGGFCLMLQDADEKVKLVFLVARKKPAEGK